MLDFTGTETLRHPFLLAYLLQPMDTSEARAMLSEQLSRDRKRSYEKLLPMLDQPETFEVDGASGTRYQVEVLAFWDDGPGGLLRVRGCIADGGWRAFTPLTDDFLLAPDGSFVGE